jgi:hypothetical protein
MADAIKLRLGRFSGRPDSATRERGRRLGSIGGPVVMRHIILAIALAVGVAAAAGGTSAQTAPPAKVCKSLLGKVIPCPPPKPILSKPAAPMAPKPVAPAQPAPAKPSLLSHFAAPVHPAASAAPAVKPPAPTPLVHPTAPSSGGGSQASRTGATAKCNDGTYWRSASHSGACSRHGGVAVFY